jgi:polyvinyl alcohol dehydrogenase (cytochrome)
MASATSWPSAGGNLHNTRNAAAETAISRQSVAGLVLKWTFAASGDIRDTPTVDGTDLFVTARPPNATKSGVLYRIDAATGSKIWSKPVSAYTGTATSLSATSPAIATDRVVLGVRDSVHGAIVLAVKRSNGALLWKTILDPLPAAQSNTSPVISGSTVIVGTSSTEETQAQTPGYTPQFRGSVQALDLATGRIRWSFRTVPAGYTGGGVFGHNLVVDAKRHAVYAGTGNNYTVPDSVTACLLDASDPSAQRACLDPTDHEDSILAIDMGTGALRWARSVIGFDTWLQTCRQPRDGALPCPTPTGPDWDFASAPNLFTTKIGGHSVDVLGAGQKSGTYWAFNPDDGSPYWNTAVGPGNTEGGIKWGSAVDGRGIYVAILNGANTPFDLGPPANLTGWQGGSWSALDPATGAFRWQVPVAGQSLVNPDFGAGAVGPMTVANGVVFAGSLAGLMVALDAASGATLWQFQAGGSVASGPAIVGGRVYWGAGDRKAVEGSPSNLLYAFGL